MTCCINTIPATPTIRPARPEDAASIVAYNLALAWETEGKRLDPAIVAAGVQALLTDPQRGFYTVAEANGQVVGQILITYEWSDWRNGWFWWLQSVYVAPAWRRRGVFRALFDHLCERAAYAGNVVGLRLYVEQDNLAAQQTYATMGLRPAGYFVLEMPLSPPATPPVRQP